MLKRCAVAFHTLLCVLGVALLTGCEQGTVFHAYKPTPVDGWEKNDTLFFDIDSLPASGQFNFVLGLRTTAAYPYQELWIVSEMHLTQPTLVHADTIKCLLVGAAGDKNGSGVNTYQYAFPFDRETLHRGQRGRISFRHIMKRESLRGIFDLGLRIEQAK
jgi:gliding motility-associated lipoprotein GldH